ncbi:sigma factor-like helix-turn-helix DNA-binding protein [Solibacillus sp. CAU 1738]|uniref:sigma factor-like helix-turn-helix DNA-binding protein n=1 Tax=Solibacillus sp. CAU 1738 TaxID=3140363 RepID=UPI003260D6CD
MIKRMEIKNPILKSFLADNDHFSLYKQYYLTPQEHIKEQINEKFEIYYTKARAVSYFSKTIHFTAQHFDRKKRLYSHRNACLLDHPSNENNSSTSNYSTSMKEQIEDDTAASRFDERLYVELKDYIQNPQLFQALLLLSPRQQQILYLIFVHNMTDTEISKRLKVTQQAITKSKNSALKKVRRFISACV